MDQALKQRLIGATVLIALGVIFLPVFIGGPDDQLTTSQNDEFLIPPQPQVSRDGSSPGRRLPLVQPSPVNPNNVGNNDSVDLSSGEIRLPRPGEALPPEIGGTDIEDGALEIDPDDLIAESQAVSVPAETTTTPPPVETPSAVITPPAVSNNNDQAADNPVPTLSSLDELEGTWRVQVASLGNPDNVARLISQIEALGFPASSQSVASNGVSLHRVIAGPFATEAQAETANRGIRSADSRLNPKVLGPAGADEAPGPTTSAAAAQTSNLDRFAVQAGVFSSAENADNLAARLNNAGYAAYSERVDSGGQVLFRVRIGPLLSESDADSIAARIDRDLGVKGIVVDYPR